MESRGKYVYSEEAGLTKRFIPCISGHRLHTALIEGSKEGMSIV